MAQVPYWIVIDNTGEASENATGVALVHSRKDGAWTRVSYNVADIDTEIGTGLTADDGTEVDVWVTWTAGGATVNTVHACMKLDQTGNNKVLGMTGAQVGNVGGLKITETDPTP